MAIIKVNETEPRQLQGIADIIASAKRIVVFTGAGISTNCGIPDFRSEDGLYSLIQAQHDGVPSSTRSSKTLGGREGPASLLLPTNTKGKDLFNSMIWKDPTSTSTFYRFIASLRKAIHDDVKRATATHRFIRTLRDRRKLVRCYT